MTPDREQELIEAMSALIDDIRGESAEISTYSAARLAIEMLRCMEVLDEGWMPIETAPRDGTRFLAFQNDDDPHIFECWWQEDFTKWEGWTDDWDTDPEPTHWRPLPAPPEGQTNDAR